MNARCRLTGFGAPLLALTLVSLPSPRAEAAGPFDGAWSVQAVAETGSCSGPYRYPIAIRDGVLADAGAHGVDTSGRAAADGRISGMIRTGLARIAVTGRLRGTRGAGKWSLGGMSACSGRWTAQRTG